MRENFQRCSTVPAMAARSSRAGGAGRLRPAAAPRAGFSPLYEWIYETAAMESFVSTERLERRLGYVRGAPTVGADRQLRLVPGASGELQAAAERRTACRGKGFPSMAKRFF